MQDFARRYQIITKIVSYFQTDINLFIYIYSNKFHSQSILKEKITINWDQQ